MSEPKFTVYLYNDADEERLLVGEFDTLKEAQDVAVGYVGSDEVDRVVIYRDEEVVEEI